MLAVHAGRQDAVVLIGAGQQVGRGLRQPLLHPRAADLQQFDCFVDVLPLAFESDQALVELAQRLGVLRRFSVALAIQFQDLADLVERQPDPLAAQDQLQAGAVAIRVNPIEPLPGRSEQPLVLVEAQRSWGGFELTAQLADRERTGQAAKFGGHVSSSQLAYADLFSGLRFNRRTQYLRLTLTSTQANYHSKS